MSTTVPGRASVPVQASGEQVTGEQPAGRTIDLDAPRPERSDRTRTDGVRDAIHVGACALAGVLVTAGFALEGDAGDSANDTGREMIAAVAQQPDRFYTGNVLAAFGLALMAAVGLAVLRLVRGRGRVLATIGGVMVMIGGTAAAAGIFMYGSVLSVMADSGQDPAQMAALQDELSDSARTGLTFIVGFSGVFLGLLVCVAALLVSHATPRWVPLTLIAGVAAVMALGSTDFSSVADVVLTAGFLGIALSLWKATRPAD